MASAKKDERAIFKSAVNATPNKTDQMDDSLKLAWQTIGPMPSNWCLAGGTGIMLYFGHRASTDLAWCAPKGSINEEVITSLLSFSEYGDLVDVHGGPGMVDCVLQPYMSENRRIEMTFLEPFDRFVPQQQQPPQEATNPSKTPVLHLIDLAACKIYAVMGRGLYRDYEDLSVMARLRPEFLREAIRQLVTVEGVQPDRCLEALVSAPHSVKLPDEITEPLVDFVTGYLDNSPDWH